MLELTRTRVEDSSAPVTVVVEIVVLCSCLDRAEAFCVMLVACLMLSVAEADVAS